MIFDRIVKLSTLFAVIFGMFLIFSFLKGCFGVSKQQQPKIEVNIKIDSTSISNAGGGQSYPVNTGQGYSKESVHDRETIYRIDTAATKQFIMQQYKSLVDEFVKSNYFDDTLHLGKYGFVALHDTTKNNKIAGRSFTPHLQALEITKTVTVTNPPEKHNQLYLYGGTEFNRQNPFKNIAVSAGVLFRAKNEEMFSAGFSQWPNYGRQYDLKYYHKISFKRKK